MTVASGHHGDEITQLVGGESANAFLSKRQALEPSRSFAALPLRFAEFRAWFKPDVANGVNVHSRAVVLDDDTSELGCLDVVDRHGARRSVRIVGVFHKLERRQTLIPD